MTDPLIGATTASFAVTLSVALSEPVDVTWSTKDGTAKAGVDYEAASGVVTFLPGETSKQIQVTVFGQSEIVPEKNFYIQLTPPTNAILGNSLVECIITVEDDEGTPVTMLVVAQGKRGLKGDPGLSAYEQAVLMGEFTGTVEEWMDEIANASIAAANAEESAAAAQASAVQAQDILVTVSALNEGQEYFATQTALLASTPTVAKHVAKALDTKKVWLWQKPDANPGTWTDTGLSELDQAKALMDANPMFKAVAVVAGNNTNNFNVDGRYKLSANLAVGNLTNWPQDSGGFHQSGTIFVLGITSGGVDYPTQLYFPYINTFKIKVRRKAAGGAWESTWSTISTLEDLMLIFSKPSDIAANNIALLSEMARYSYFGKQFTNAEIIGTAVYATNTYYVGLNAIHTAAVNFNKLKARIWNPTAGDIEYRIFTGANVLSSANGYYVPQANTGNYSFSGTCKVFPTADNGIDNVIEFDQIIAIPANTPFVIAFKHATLATFRIGHHTALSGNLVSRGFNLGATSAASWALNITAANPAAFLEAGFQLLLDVVGTSSNTTTYVPTLVVPPKIYALEGLESHVYPEHTLVEDYHLYEHDVTCTKGIHKKRGWVWTPSASDVAGNYALTLAVHDKQKATQLATATSTIVLANKNAYSGLTKNVSIIGDSIIYAGVISQRLLDIAVSDVMDVNLIGTRGTGPNFHEGRGGYTISDYTTAGRTYQKFTVSGVTTTPAINSATYTYNGATFLVQETALTGGAGTITCSLSSGSAPTAGSSGTLTKLNASAGDATIAFSNVQPVSGNPFWFGGTLNYASYLSTNSLATPDYVLIQLGINDTFNMTSDAAVEAFTTTAFPSLDLLINSIKVAAPSAKIGICAPQSYADQDAFGYNYQNNQTAWRAKRNIVTYNKMLYAYYQGKEAQNIYVVGGGVNVDTENNYPVSSAGVPVNSHNTKLEYPQVNGVHPADSGYKQIGDVFYAFLKAV